MVALGPREEPSYVMDLENRVSRQVEELPISSRYCQTAACGHVASIGFWDSAMEILAGLTVQRRP
jgi:hypothetical protein